LREHKLYGIRVRADRLATLLPTVNLDAMEFPRAGRSAPARMGQIIDRHTRNID